MKIIYNSNVYEIYTENEIIEFLKDNDMAITKENIDEEYIFYRQLDYDDTMLNLDKILDNNIICIANLGLWNGRKSGYKILGNNLNEILEQAHGDYYKVYYDGFNVKAEDSHHDGTNYYTFREVKPNVNIDTLLDKIYSDKVTKDDINRYTTSLRRYVKDIYGW